MQALAAGRLDVCEYARQTLRRVHELALDAHAAQEPAQPAQEPRAPGEVRSGTLLAARRGGRGAANEGGLADDATLLRALQGALAGKRAIAGWPDGLPRLTLTLTLTLPLPLAATLTLTRPAPAARRGAVRRRRIAARGAAPGAARRPPRPRG